MKKENHKMTMVKIHYPLTQCDTLKSILLLGFLTKLEGFVFKMTFWGLEMLMMLSGYAIWTIPMVQNEILGARHGFGSSAER